MEQQRLHPRTESEIPVELHFLQDSPRSVLTRNISQGGLFLNLGNADHYPLGELVNLYYNNPLNDDQRTEKDAVIVRTGEGGIAVAFIEMGAI